MCISRSYDTTFTIYKIEFDKTTFSQFILTTPIDAEIGYTVEVKLKCPDKNEEKQKEYHFL